MIFQLIAVILLGIFYSCYFGKMDRPEAKRNTDRSDWKRKDRNGKSDRTDDESGHTVGSGT